MRRPVIAAATIGAAAAIAIGFAGRPGLTQLLVVLAVLLVSGVGPFAFGVVVRLLWKMGDVPLAVSWVFGVALGVVRLVAPQLGGLSIVQSRPLSALLTVVLGASFAELGISATEAFVRRQNVRRTEDERRES